MTGVGYVPLDWLFCVCTALAAVVQCAVLRSPDVGESRIVNGTRRLRLVAWSILFLRTAFVLTTAGDLLVPIYSLMPLLMLVLADIFSGMARLFTGELSALVPTQTQREKPCT